MSLYKYKYQITAICKIKKNINNNDHDLENEIAELIKIHIHNNIGSRIDDNNDYSFHVSFKLNKTSYRITVIVETYNTMFVEVFRKNNKGLFDINKIIGNDFYEKHDIEKIVPVSIRLNYSVSFEERF